jgi:class 3 adenylate cyclase
MGADMSARTARRLAWGGFALYVLLVLASLAFGVATKSIPGHDAPWTLGNILFLLSTTAFPIVAILILNRQPLNRIGWILMAIGLGWVIGPETYGSFALSRGLPGGALAIALSSGTWAIPIGLMGTVLLLRFPNGRLQSSGWRWIERISLFSIVLVTVAISVSPGDLGDSGFPELRNPLGINALKPLPEALGPVLMLIPAMIGAAAVGLILRFRRAGGTERVQLKALAAAAAAVAAAYLVAMLASVNQPWYGPETSTGVVILQDLAVMSFLLIPIAIGVAILKHRLYDVEVIVNRAVVFGVVVASITAVYVGVVAGIGAAVGSSTSSNVALPIVATAVVAVAFQPLVVRARRFADRVVYGRRATPYEALAALAGPGSAAEVSARVARLAVDSTAARRAIVLLRAGQEFRPVAWWPEDDDAPSPVPMSVGDRPTVSREVHTESLTAGGEVLGLLSVRTGGEALPAADARLLADLATQGAVALDRALRVINLPEGIVTLVMTDVEGSTPLWEAEPSAMARGLAEHDALIEDAVSTNDGLLIRARGEGDSTFSVFVDAVAAVRATLAMQRALSAHAWPTARPIRIRAGIHTGEVQRREEDYYGSMPNRCARLRGIAHGEQTVLSKVTRDAVGGSLPPGTALLDLGIHRLKGLSAPEHVFQLCHPDLRLDFPPLQSLDAVPNNLPGTEVTEPAPGLALVRGMLSRGRVVTLVGEDGSAALDLALQAAAEGLEGFPGGVWYVAEEEGASISDSLIRAIRGTGADVEELFGERPALLVLEARSRSEAGSFVLDMLDRYPKLRVLAASDAQLGVEGENLFMVEAGSGRAPQNVD